MVFSHEPFLTNSWLDSQGLPEHTHTAGIATVYWVNKVTPSLSSTLVGKQRGSEGKAACEKKTEPFELVVSFLAALLSRQVSEKNSFTAQSTVSV